jgi:hypothetical protein
MSNTSVSRRHVLKRVARAVAFKMPAWGYTVSSALIVGVLYLGALTPAPALALPEGRVYELVSPVYKGGYGVGAQGAIAAVAPDGESVAYYSAGAFAGLPTGAEEFDYLARRGSSGWSTEPFGMPATVLSFVIRRDVSSTLDSTLALGKPGPNVEGAFHQGLEEEVFLHSPGSGDAGDTWTSAGVVMKRLDEKAFDGAAYRGGSADLCHLFFNLSEGPLLPQASEAGDPHGVLYELDRGCAGGQPSLRVVGLNNSGKLINPACITDLGSGEHTVGALFSVFNAVEDGGGEVFFGSGVGNTCVPDQLFVRLDGSRTLEVSRPLEASRFGGCVGEVGGAPGEVPCAGAASRASANFVGASEDGSRVFFTTKAPLVGGGDGTNNLYMASIGCPPGEPGCEVAGREVTSLVQVSHDLSGGSAEVQGTVRVATDGSRVYFVARGELLSQTQLKTLEGEKRAVPHLGADNLYVYDAAGGSVAFVADLCSTSEQSGTVRDRSCPSGLGTDLERHSHTEAQANSCRPGRSSCEPGRFLVFSTFARLTASDTNEAKDVYRYDAVTGIIERVSVGEAGYHANGNCEGGDGQGQCDATIPEGYWDGGRVSEQYEMNNRAVTEDGSRVVFTTAEPLSPAAVNGLANVYEWHQAPGEAGEGHVSLISSGSGEPTEDAVISPEGRDIFFVTSQGLVAQDTDGEADIYDARLGGGFQSLAVAAAPCEGDACQGPLTNPAPLLVPGSVSQAPGQNFAAPTSKPVVKAKPKPKKKVKKKKKSKVKQHAGKAANNRRASR